MNTNTTVINIRTNKNGTYIGRKKGVQFHFGNPFSHLNLAHTIKVPNRETSIAAFKQWLDGDPRWVHVEPERRTWILANLHTLKGKRLVCFCAPKGCHGDVYVSLLHRN